MKLKDGLILRKIAGEYIVVPVGRMSQIAPMMQITSSTAWLWEVMQNGDFTIDSLVTAVLGHFSGVTEEVARQDVENFVALLKKNGMLDDGTPEPIQGSVKVELSKKDLERLQKKNGTETQ